MGDGGRTSRTYLRRARTTTQVPSGHTNGASELGNAPFGRVLLEELRGGAGAAHGSGRVPPQRLGHHHRARRRTMLFQRVEDGVDRCGIEGHALRHYAIQHERATRGHGRELLQL